MRLSRVVSMCDDAEAQKARGTARMRTYCDGCDMTVAWPQDVTENAGDVETEKDRACCCNKSKVKEAADVHPVIGANRKECCIA